MLFASFVLDIMSPKIKILPDHVINKIAAGEVVERPSSVVKELIENSIDAGATEILVDIEQAGRRLIRVTDNGCGMSREDAGMAFERHATSKITSDADLQAVRTMGFRGEALSSIAAVSRIKMLSACRGASSGVMIEFEGGTIKAVEDAAAAQGTSLEIAHLFYNTPARLKFLKSPATEFSHIVTALSRQAIAHPAVRFRLMHNKKPVLDLPASQIIRERVFQLYGNEIAENLVEFAGGRDAVQVHGLLARPGYTRADKTYQDFYVNQRAVRNASLVHALYGAYADLLMRDRHPVAFVFIDIDPALVDVNVHPAKAEVRFRNQSQVHDLVRDLIREGVRVSSGVSPASETHAERVKEAVAGYYQNAEFGMRSAEFPLTPTLSPEGRGGNNPRAQGQSAQLSSDLEFGASHSAFRIPNSEFLYPLAQVHDSFIIAQSQEGMAIVDQHAAHERVLFEKLQYLFGNAHIPLQNLLIPVPVELGAAQSILLNEHLPELIKIGLLVEDFGNGTFMIKAVPSLLSGADYKKLLLDILDEVNMHGKSGKFHELRDGILSVMACHPAVKVNRGLDVREMEQLLADLFKCRMPHTCPHGRPTVIRFSIDEIKKMFKRI